MAPVADVPPTIETAAGAAGEEADAAPVARTAGMGGLGRTFDAVASPAFETTSFAVNVCPRSMLEPPEDGARVSDPTERMAGRCTVALAGAAEAVTVAPLLTSVPVIPAENASVPELVLASW